MIITECYNDQQLMFRIGFARDHVEHRFGKSKVLGRIEEKRKERQQAIGVIDEDPQAGDPAYLNKYDERDAIGSIKLMERRNDDGKRVVSKAIQISPRLEDWLYGVAKRNRISPESFNLPDDPDVLHDMSLRSRRNMANFQRFLIALNRAKDNEIETLKQWIRDAITE